MSCQHDAKFDSKRWKESGSESITLDARANMVNNLMDSRILINKSELEIAELIGNPEKLNITKKGNYKYYPIQEKYGLDIDPEEMSFLEIHFSKKGLSDFVKLFMTK